MAAGGGRVFRAEGTAFAKATEVGGGKGLEDGETRGRGGASILRWVEFYA